MPVIVSKPCAHPGCRTLVPVGTTRCERHRDDEKEERWRRSDQARSNRPWRRWYKLKAWKQLRVATLVRDEFTCQWTGCGVALVQGRKSTRSAVVDHKIPHRGNWTLFIDPQNVWALCKQCHDRRKQSVERQGGGVSISGADRSGTGGGSQISAGGRNSTGGGASGN